jgi:TRAP-type uncharacterized transport system substrate-binding protein
MSILSEELTDTDYCKKKKKVRVILSVSQQATQICYVERYGVKKLSDMEGVSG